MSYLFSVFFLTHSAGRSVSEYFRDQNGQRSSPSVLRRWEPRVHVRSFRFVFRSQLRIVTMGTVRN